jgi:hypothetical protein
MMKHQTGKHDQVQASQSSRKPLIVAHQASERSTTHRRESRDKASFRLWKFDDLQSDPVFFGCLSRSITRVASIDKGNFDRLSGGLLNRLGKLTHLSMVLLIGRSHQQAQEVAQRIDGCMHFTALASLGSIITRMVATDLASIARFDYQRWPPKAAFELELLTGSSYQSDRRVIMMVR